MFASSDVIRIIRPAIPAKRLLAHPALPARNVFQEFIVAVRPAAILRRAAPLPAKKLWILHSPYRRTQSFSLIRLTTLFSRISLFRKFSRISLFRNFDKGLTAHLRKCHNVLAQFIKA
jgi:hypothetical protein